ncbi:hypothetical protein [Burkholderia ubonensis]|uniref:hypothetical protein n=1 Tax=Burkholderia ubonensis TaxID=101571 RepID=UPI00075D7AF2|nr:hypothetical protein [Burkholderia ubonensis]KVC83985.1 hypothetical protein WI75_04765 [Burkholderia ubonensis]
MDWHQPLVINGGMLYSGQMGERWLGEFSSLEAAREGVSLKRDGVELIDADDTHCMTESDVDMLEAIDADEA